MVRLPTARSAIPAVPELIAAGILGDGISLSLSTLMLVAKLQHITALPMPLSVAFAAHLFGKATLGKTLLLPIGLLLHVGYVSTATVIAAVVFRRHRGFAAAFGTALVLWMLAGVSILPYVGWGLFGLGLGAGAAGNVLAVHLLYGAFLWAGFWLAFRTSPSEKPAESARAPVTTAAGVHR